MFCVRGKGLTNRRHFRLSRYAALLCAACFVNSGAADADGTITGPLEPPRSQARVEQQVSSSPQTRAGGFFRLPDLPFSKELWPARQAPFPAQRSAGLEARATSDSISSK